jgi:tetratricopeptide (TPR) repeat protein
LEASLLKDQRHPEKALALLEEAAAVGRCPERALIIKGIILEKMGEYETAVETLLRADSLVDRNADPLLKNRLSLNLSVNFCHLSQYKEAAELVNSARPLSVELGDEIVLVRITWLEGRIAAGLGRPWEALRLLRQARRRFSAERMSYDVALALLEEAALLLDEDRTVEVKALSQELTEVFNSKGVHREALAALRLFHEAAERETASAELARRVLRFLFRARYDQDLRFTAL